MGYKTPIVCKEVYLPLDFKFIDDNGGETFKDFASAYKDEYGIDLHDIFELRYFKNLYQLVVKSPTKIYVVSVSDISYRNFKNIVKEGIVSVEITATATNSLLVIAVILNEGASGYGIRIYLPAEVTPNLTIDDLYAGLYEI